MSLVNTDIYNIVQSISDLRKKYIKDETEDTLALGMYGYIGDLESKKIQTAIMMVGELSNEMFPSRAKLDKNIITHAIMQNITDINATPSYMTVVMFILKSDLDKYMVNNKFVLDKTCPIVIGADSNNFEFHLDYDIIITSSDPNSTNPTYSAVYDMSIPNRISKLDNPYLNQPYTILLNNTTCVALQCTIRQVEFVEEYSQLVTSNIIDNKTTTFRFSNQLTDFEVYITEGGKTYNLTPVFEGSGIDADIDLYCNYIFINDNTVRIKFERTSYMPGLNAEIRILIKTTQGSYGNFNFTDNININYSSDIYSYKDINILLHPSTDSKGGIDKKSIEELQSILPKEILSRGMISTDKDLSNYFNLINNENERMVSEKKVDNQIERIYYEYFLMKDEDSNIVPTNTLNTISINYDQFETFADQDSFVLPAGSIIEYDDATFIGEVITAVGPTTSQYVYSTLYTIIVNRDPLYCALYMTLVKENPFLSFNYINQLSTVQFIGNYTTFERKITQDKDTYKLNFTMNQSINKDMGILVFDDDGNLIETNVRTFIVFYRKGIPYRYIEANLKSYDYYDFNYNWGVDLITDNSFDLENRIKIKDLKTVGTGEVNYGYLDDSTETYIYTLAKFDKSYGLHDLAPIIPNLSDYTVTNKYKIYGNLNFFINYSGILNARIDVSNDVYKISGIPVLGYEYATASEDNVFSFINKMNYKKLYIDNAITVLENSFEIDFKFFNTYGPSRTYTVDDIDDNGSISIGRLDIEINFKLSLKLMSDIYTKESIIESIKSYVESLDTLDDLHISNMVNFITEKFKSTINYIEFMGFNTYDANYQHMYKQVRLDKNIVPEFINIRNKLDIDGNKVPCINIETVTSTTTS